MLAARCGVISTSAVDSRTTLLVARFRYHLKIGGASGALFAKVLKDLTPRELSILQKLSPPKRFMIEPGESSTFVIVFMDPPNNAVEFSAQVIAAHRQT